MTNITREAIDVLRELPAERQRIDRAGLAYASQYDEGYHLTDEER